MAGPGQARFYSSTFVQTSLASGISAGATSFNVGTTTGAPGTPFVVSVDQNTASEELMLVTNVSGLQYTATRGIGGTAAVSHNNGAPVVHVMYSQDLTDASIHEGSFDAVHGLSVGSLVVGTTDTQTLTNKTLTSPVINTPTISSPTITGTVNVGLLVASGLITASDFKATGLTGAVAASRYVGATASGAPASGTFLLGDFTIDQTGILWICTTAGTPGTWTPQINTTATQTLSNKTLATPTVTGTLTSNGAITTTGFVEGANGVGGNTFSANGVSGASTATQYTGGTASGPPTSGTFGTGNFVVDITGSIWVCTSGGTPGSWTPVGGAQNFMAIPILTASNGPATTSTTDTIDSTLGNYVFTAVAGRRYRVKMFGLFGNGSVASDVFAVRIRDSGSASTPTTASPAVVDSMWVSTVTGTSGRNVIEMEDSFIASTSGSHTLAFFAQRISGSGVFTPSCAAATGATGSRKLWVEDAGLV
jgi:hypothetical protein